MAPTFTIALCNIAVVQVMKKFGATGLRRETFDVNLSNGEVVTLKFVRHNSKEKINGKILRLTYHTRNLERYLSFFAGIKAEGVIVFEDTRHGAKVPLEPKLQEIIDTMSPVPTIKFAIEKLLGTWLGVDGITISYCSLKEIVNTNIENLMETIKNANLKKLEDDNSSDDGSDDEDCWEEIEEKTPIRKTSQKNDEYLTTAEHHRRTIADQNLTIVDQNLTIVEQRRIIEKQQKDIEYLEQQLAKQKEKIDDFRVLYKLIGSQICTS